MASGLRLGEPLQLGIRKIHGLSSGSAEELRTALENADLVVRADDLIEEVALHVQSISRNDIEEIIDTLSGLGSIVSSADVPIDVFVEDVCAVVEDSKHPIDLAGGARELLKKRLSVLLDNRAVLVASKARDVFTEHEHYLCYARIITDIRPVFSRDVGHKPTAAMIAHTLKLVYHEGTDTKEIFIALDPSSLTRLTALIERAKMKEETLKSVLGSVDVQYLDRE